MVGATGIEPVTPPVETGVLREEGEFLVFTSDYSFASASAAAATVIGASANGRILWKLADGRPYADWEANQFNDSGALGTSLRQPEE